ncbi:hypothetical protein C8R43DRAFT_169899 [Mycena crocata]|nr:hypothetical protein C8R43DRAFT_169899 [Mycena crocata]
MRSLVLSRIVSFLPSCTFILSKRRLLQSYVYTWRFDVNSLVLQPAPLRHSTPMFEFTCTGIYPYHRWCIPHWTRLSSVVKGSRPHAVALEAAVFLWITPVRLGPELSFARLGTFVFCFLVSHC